MKEKNYETKKIYYLLLGLKNSITKNSLPQNIIYQYNSLLGELEVLLDESLNDYKYDINQKYNDNTYNPNYLFLQLNPVLTYLENMHINSSDYEINKVGYLYKSIEDKELHDRCGDILLGENAYDRAINQATQILEDRIKKKAKLEKTSLIGIPLMAKAIHSKLDQTILKFSDEPDIQEGYSYMFKGIVSIYRNPTHHSLKFKCSREYALKFCAYIDELLKEVERSVLIEK